MTRQTVVFLFAFAWVSVCAAQTSPVSSEHYRIFRADGSPSSLDEMLEEASQSEVILVGENHNDPVAHHMEAVVLEGVHDAARGGRVALSMEMFSRDVQHVVDEYLEGLIRESHFLADTRPWNNYETDYRPLVEYARENGLDVIAANSPRRYTNIVTRNGRAGLSELPETSLKDVAPLPYGEASDEYRRQWLHVMGIESDSVSMPETIHGMNAANMLDAQSLWDATMAYSIASYLLKHRGAQVVHMVGSFHVNNHTGIPEHLNAYRPGVRMLVISVEPASDIEVFDPDVHKGLGDFVVLSDESLPRSYSSSRD